MSKNKEKSQNQAELVSDAQVLRKAHIRWRAYQRHLNKIDYSSLHYSQKISGTNKL